MNKDFKGRKLKVGDRVLYVEKFSSKVKLAEGTIQKITHNGKRFHLSQFDVVTSINIYKIIK